MSHGWLATCMQELRCVSSADLETCELGPRREAPIRLVERIDDSSRATVEIACYGRLWRGSFDFFASSEWKMGESRGSLVQVEGFKEPFYGKYFCDDTVIEDIL